MNTRDMLLAAGEFCCLSDRVVMMAAARIAPIPVPPAWTPPVATFRDDERTLDQLCRELDNPARRIVNMPASARVDIGGVFVGMATNIVMARKEKPSERPPDPVRVVHPLIVDHPLEAYVKALGWQSLGRDYRRDGWHMVDPHGRHWLLPSSIVRGPGKDLEFWIASRMENTTDTA